MKEYKDGYNFEGGRTLAIVSYITLIGTLIAFFLNQDKKDEFAAFHVRQALGVWLLQIMLAFVVSSFDSWSATYAFYIAIIILLIYGIFTAIIGKARPIPVIGTLFQNVFKTLGS